jgi:double zinc ribbon protein
MSDGARKEFGLIPAWAIVLACLAFVGMQVLLHVVVARQPDAPPPIARVFLGLLAGVVLGAAVLLIGYVNVDAGRRGMSRTLWTFIVVLVPNALGFLLYFLLRKPPQVMCPKCAAQLPGDSTFCSKCGNQLRPTCPSCGAAMQAGDVYCARCGKTLARAV